MNKQEIEENISILKSIIPEYKKRGRTFGVNALNTAISALEQQLNNRWIPVSERLPKVHERYLVNMKHKSLNETFIDCRYFYSDYQFEYRDDFERRNWEVIVWQPLPEPYKEES